MTKALLPATIREGIEPHLPDWIDATFWETGEELIAHAPEAEIGWFDMFDKEAPLKAIAAATKLKWLHTVFAGVDWMPLAQLEQRGVKLSNGSGINANAVAEFAVMAMLGEARGFADIVRAQDKCEWLKWPSSMRELAGSRALIMGYGEIGQAIGRMLKGFNVDVVPMRRSGADGALRPDQWRAQVGEFDWIILAMPGTPETKGMISADVIAAMKKEAILVNVARADIVDQAGLASALHGGSIGGAILDLTDPEPLESNDPLWKCPNIRITMHIAGLPTPQMRARSGQRFLSNCESYRSGLTLEAQVDLNHGY